MLSLCSAQNLSQEASVEYSDFEFIIHILILFFYISVAQKDGEVRGYGRLLI